MCELTHHCHEVCLATDPDGRTQVCAEWQLAFDDAPADAFRLRAGPPVRICFCADAATLRELALAMAACADELDAIQARTARYGAIAADWRDCAEPIVLYGGEPLVAAGDRE